MRNPKPKKRRLNKRDKRKCCGNKIKFSTREEAIQSMCTVVKNNLIVTYLRVYKCPYCKKWHMGKTKKINWNKINKKDTN